MIRKRVLVAGLAVVCAGLLVGQIVLGQPDPSALQARIEEIQLAWTWQQQIAVPPNQPLLGEITAIADVLRPELEPLMDPALSDRAKRSRLLTPAISLWRGNATPAALSDTLTLLNSLEPWLEGGVL